MVEDDPIARAKAIKALRARTVVVRERAIAQLCAMFEPLVKAQAKVYRHTEVERDDLEQTARVGLLVACRTFNPRKGAFPSHAVWCIRNALSKHVEAWSNPVRLPAWMIRQMPKLRRLTVALAQKLQREPTRKELADSMQMPEHAIETMLAYDAYSTIQCGENYGVEE